MDGQDTGIGATLAQILLKQGEMGIQLAVISEQLKTVPDHEQRIRQLERWKYSMPVAGLLAIGSTIAAVLSLFRH